MHEKNIKFSSVKQFNGDTWNDYLHLHRITTEGQTQVAIFQKVSSEKAIKAEFLAMNSLTFPNGCPHETPVFEQARVAYEYLLRFDERGLDQVDMFEAIPALKTVCNRRAPQWLKDQYNSMDACKEDAYDQLSRMPPGVTVHSRSGCLWQVDVPAEQRT